MQVKLIIYADKNKYSAKLISGKHQKKITGKPNKNSEIKTLLIGLISAVQKIKYPVELYIVNDNLTLKKVFDEGIKNNQNKSFIIDNLTEWKKLANLIKQHEHFIFSLPEKENDLNEINQLMRDCLYKRF